MLLGAVLVIKPSFMTIIPSLIGILSPMLGGISYNLIRALKDKVNPNVIVFLFSLFSVLCSIPLMYSDFVLPNASQLFLLIAIGVTASMGQFWILILNMLRYQELSIYNYTGIIFLECFWVLLSLEKFRCIQYLRNYYNNYNGYTFI